MKRNTKRNRKIRNLVLICVMSALLLTVGTYAWFIGMQTVKVNSFEVKIAGVDNLMLSLDGVKWSTALDLADTENYPQYEGNANQLLTGEKEGLKPISTIGKFDEDASRLVLFEKGSLTATTGGYRLMASRVENNTTKKAGTEQYQEGDGYVAFDLFVMNLSGDEYYPEISDPSNEEAIYLTYDSSVVTGDTGTVNSGIENSVRVAFGQIARVSATGFYPLDKTKDTTKIATLTGLTCSSVENSDKHAAVTKICRDAQIWEPNENTHVAAAKKWYTTTCKVRKTLTEGKKGFEYDPDGTCKSLDTYTTTNAVAGEIVESDYVDVYDGSYNNYAGTATTLLNPVDTFTDSEKLQTGTNRIQFMSLAPNSITKIRVYIWIEGQDVDNYDFASLGYSIKVNFGFTKERITTGEIDPSIKPGSDLNAETKPENADPALPEDEEETPVPGGSGVDDGSGEES